MKKGTILISLGLLLIAAAFSLVGYNLYESYRAGKAADSIMSELEDMIAEANIHGDGVDGSSDDGHPEGSEGGEMTPNNSSGTEGDTPNETITSARPQATNNSIQFEENEEANLGELYPDRDMPSVTIHEIGYAGWIFIPSLSLRLPVQSVWNYGMLDISPAIYSGSVYQDNMIIGGHSYITHFRSLRGIAPGAKVTFFDTEGFSYEYEVAYVMNLNPNQGAVLSDEKNEDWDLTLFTCNTGGQTRCVVRCERVE